MKTTLLKEDFYQMVLICTRFLAARPNLPVLNNLLIEARKNKLRLSATNLETAIKIESTAKNEGDWETTIPGRIINEFMSQAKGKEVLLEEEKENIKITSGEINASLASISAGEFPKLPTLKTKTEEYETKTLYQAVSQVAFSASHDEGKPILTGILLKKEKEGTLAVATDGYRLAKKVIKSDYNFDRLVVPAKTLVEALKVANEMGSEKVSMALSEEENQLFITGDSFALASRVLDGVYPQFEQIIPNQFVATVRAEKEKLTDAIKAAAVFAKDIGNVVKIKIKKEEIEVSANTAQVGEATASLPAEISGEEIKVAFNSQYVLEGLAAIKEDSIKISLSGSLSPALITAEKNDGFSYIVMPIKAQS